MRLLITLLVVCALAFGQNPATAKYPDNVMTDADIGVLNQSAQTKLNGAINDSATEMTLVDATRFIAPVIVTIGTEKIKCGTRVGNVLSSCTRGYNVGNGATTAAAHADQSDVFGYIEPSHINQLAAEVKAIETNAVKGTLTGTITAPGTATNVPNEPAVVTYLNNYAATVTSALGGKQPNIAGTNCPFGIRTISFDNGAITCADALTAWPESAEPSNPLAGQIPWLNNLNHMFQLKDTDGNLVSTTVAPLAAPNDSTCLDYIGTDGVQHRKACGAGTGTAIDPFPLAVTLVASASPISVSAETHGQGVNPHLDCWHSTGGGAYELASCPQVDNDGSGNLTITFNPPWEGKIVLSAAAGAGIAQSALTTTLDGSSTDEQVPSAKAVYDAVQAGTGHTQNTDTGTDQTTFTIPSTGCFVYTSGMKMCGDGSGGMVWKTAADATVASLTSAGVFTLGDGSTYSETGVEIAKPSTPPPAGSGTTWFDSTAHLPQYMRDGSTTVVGTMVQPAASRTANQFVTHVPSTGVPTTAAIAAADIDAAISGSNPASFPTLNQDTSGSAAKVPSGASPTIDAAGKVGVDTTSDQFQFYGGAKRALPSIQHWSIVIPSVAESDSMLFVKLPYGVTLVAVDAIVSAATSIEVTVQECNSSGASCADMHAALPATTTGANTTTFSDATGAAGNWLKLALSQISGTPGTLTVTVQYRVVAD